MRLGLMSEMRAAIRASFLPAPFPFTPTWTSAPVHAHERGETAPRSSSSLHAVSGQRLSVREIEQLAHGFFRGPDSFRRRSSRGIWLCRFSGCKQAPAEPDGCSEFERVLLRIWSCSKIYASGSWARARTPRLKSRVFHAQGQSSGRRHFEPQQPFPTPSGNSMIEPDKRKAIFLLHDQGGRCTADRPAVWGSAVPPSADHCAGRGDARRRSQADKQRIAAELLPPSLPGV